MNESARKVSTRMRKSQLPEDEVPSRIHAAVGVLTEGSAAGRGGSAAMVTAVVAAM